ncbi:MAG: T9SS type A sorting domain-containing protein [bacterium]
MMKRYKGGRFFLQFAMVFALIAIMCSVSQAQKLPARITASDTAKFIITPDTLSFGTLSVGASKVIPITALNAGSGIGSITSITGSQGWMNASVNSLTALKRTYPANSSATSDFTFMASAVGNGSGTLTFKYFDGMNNKTEVFPVYAFVPAVTVTQPVAATDTGKTITVGTTDVQLKFDSIGTGGANITINKMPDLPIPASFQGVGGGRIGATPKPTVWAIETDAIGFKVDITLPGSPGDLIFTRGPDGIWKQFPPEQIDSQSKPGFLILRGVTHFSEWLVATPGSPTPTITSISQTTGARGETYELVLSGSGFIPGAVVNLGSMIDVKSFTAVSDKEAIITIAVNPDAPTGVRDLSVANPGGGTGTLANAFAIENPSPQIVSISTLKGLRGQTYSVTVNGSNFITGMTSASFGTAITVNSFSVTNGNQGVANITIASNAAVGTRSVVITNAAPGGGSDTLANVFLIEYHAPKITSLSPQNANVGSTLTVQVNGTGFTQNVSTISFGAGITVNSFSVLASNLATVGITIAATATGGPRDVIITTPTPGGGSDTVNAGFTVGNLAPVLSQVTPSIVLPGTQAVVTLSGSNFIVGGTTVDFGAGITVSNFTITSSTEATATLVIGASATPGSRTVTLTNPAPGGGSYSMPNAIAIGYLAPAITGIAPASGVRGTSVNVTITGQNFYTGQTTVSFGTGITVGSFTIVSATQATAILTIASSITTGSRDVIVTTPAPGGGSSTFTNGFSVVNPAPTATALTPVETLVGTTLDVTITGTGFYSTVTTLNFGANIVVNNLTFTSETSLKANITVALSAAVGARDVIVTNAAPGGGSVTLAKAFTIKGVNPVPTLITLTPAKGYLDSTLNVTLTGSNFTQGLTTVSFGADITLISFTVNSATSATARITISKTAALGERNVTVTNPPPGGGTSSPMTFTVDKVTSVELISEVIPMEYALYENFPNPFNPSTRIRFALSEGSSVKLTVYNLLGKPIAELVNNSLNAGIHQVSWNAMNAASGIYIIRMTAESNTSGKTFIATSRAILLK